MPAPQSLIQATLNRLVVRVGSSLADAAAELALLAQDAERLRREWQLFVEEVELEADRLDQGDSASPSEGAWSADGSAPSPGTPERAYPPQTPAIPGPDRPAAGPGGRLRPAA
jgi:hypothetical protein